MSTTNRIDQINLLIANALLRGEAVELPSVATISVKYISARLESGNFGRGKLTPPRRTLECSNEVVGRSIIEMIEQISGCDTERAHDIYGNWLNNAKCAKGVVIDGVATIGNVVIVEAEFNKRLNPSQASETLLTPRRQGKHIAATLSAVVLLAAIGYGAFMVMNNRDLFTSPDNTQVTVAEEVKEIKKSEPATKEAVETKEETPVVTPTTKEEAKQPEAKNEKPSQPQEITIERMTSQNYYVVYGVFTSQRNAKNALTEIRKTMDLPQSGVYNFGAKYMVSLFNSSDAAAANTFRRQCKIKGADIWNYRAK